MSHEIEQNDNVVLLKKRAWHGLGIVVDEAPTPHEALKLAGMDWGIDQRQLLVRGPSMDNEFSFQQKLIEVHGKMANYRSDTGDFMGLVSDSYVPVDNAAMADFCSALVDHGDVRCETAGSVRNGQRVWFLLQGDKFEVANGDEMFPYVLVSNGHDGLTSFRITPTTVRAVCSNTLHMVIPGVDTGTLGKSAIAIRHHENVFERIEEAKMALKHYSTSLEDMKKVAAQMSQSLVTVEEIKTFFLECYTVDFGDIPANPKDKVEERRRNRAMSAFNSFSKRFDDEQPIAGASWWNAANAYSGLVQQDQKARGKNDADRLEKRVDSNLFGLNEQRTQNAFRKAYALAQ